MNGVASPNASAESNANAAPRSSALGGERGGTFTASERTANESVQKERRHHAQRERIGGRVSHVFAAPKATIRVARAGVHCEAAFGAAGGARRPALPHRRFAAQPAHSVELCRAETTVEQVFDVERDIEPTPSIAQ